MGILGIKNRTENWKTARTFAPFFEDKNRLASLANRLLREDNRESFQPNEVRIELFWKGIRDWVHLKGEEGMDYSSDFANRFKRLFYEKSDLRRDIVESDLFRKLKEHNYCASPREEALYRNLINTEIDIVMESTDHLFIGEAKHEMTFGADSELVLVHQLIRQYVTAEILADRVNPDGYPKKKVVPFVVGDDAAKLLKNHQVQFMVCQGWLKESNVLSWDNIGPAGGIANSAQPPLIVPQSPRARKRTAAARADPRRRRTR